MADEPNTIATAASDAVAGTPKRQYRRRRFGMVTSDRCEKSITVSVDYLVRHPKYGKYVRRRSKLHAHDENNEAKVGDRVEIGECRPYSKTKSWRLVRILKRGPQG